MDKKAKDVKAGERRMTTDEFAKIANNCKPKTVRGYCRRIDAGDENFLRLLGKEYGLVKVERASNKWLLTVMVPQ